MSPGEPRLATLHPVRRPTGALAAVRTARVRAEPGLLSYRDAQGHEQTWPAGGDGITAVRYAAPADPTRALSDDLGQVAFLDGQGAPVLTADVAAWVPNPELFALGPAGAAAQQDPATYTGVQALADVLGVPVKTGGRTSGGLRARPGACTALQSRPVWWLPLLGTGAGLVFVAAVLLVVTGITDSSRVWATLVAISAGMLFALGLLLRSSELRRAAQERGLALAPLVRPEPAGPASRRFTATAALGTAVTGEVVVLDPAGGELWAGGPQDANGIVTALVTEAPDGGTVQLCDRRGAPVVVLPLRDWFGGPEGTAPLEAWAAATGVRVERGDAPVSPLLGAQYGAHVDARVLRLGTRTDEGDYLSIALASIVFFAFAVWTGATVAAVLAALSALVNGAPLLVSWLRAATDRRGGRP